MWNKIIEYFYPFSYESDKFVLKHQGTWYSNKFRHVYYSGNGGKSFRRILESKQPLFTHGDTIFEYNWSYEYFTFSIETQAFSSIRKQFDSLKTIEDFMNQQYARYLRGLKEHELKKKEYIKRIERNSK